MSLTDVLKWIAFAKAILPLALAAKGVGSEKIGSIVQTATDAETALGPGSGTQKLAAVVDGVTASMHASGASADLIATTTAAVTSGLQTGIALVNEVQQIHKADAPAVAPPKA